MLAFLLEVLVIDCLPPILLSAALYFAGWRFLESALLFCACEIFVNLFVEHFDWKFQHKLTRQLAAPVLAPGFVIGIFLQMAEAGWLGEDSEFRLGQAYFAYFTYLGYRVGMAVLEPVVDLMIFGPTNRSLRREIHTKVQAWSAALTGKILPQEEGEAKS